MAEGAAAEAAAAGAGAAYGAKETSAAASAAAATAEAAAGAEGTCGYRPMRDDPRYKQGVALMQKGRFDDAADVFGQLLGTLAPYRGEMHISLAPLYFQYGSAVLALAEQGSGDLAAFDAGLAKAAQKAAGSAASGAAAAQAMVTLAKAQEAAAAANGGGSASGGAAKPSAEAGEGGDQAAAEVDGMKATMAAVVAEDAATREQEEDDLELAWQMLDISRKLAEQSAEVTAAAGDSAAAREARLALARAHDRLADLHSVNGNDAGAVEELEAEVLALEAARLPPTCEHLADVRLRLTMAYVAAAAHAGTPEDAKRVREMALDQGSKSRAAFDAAAKRIAAALPTATPAAAESSGNAGADEAEVAQQSDAAAAKAALQQRMEESDGGATPVDRRESLARVRGSMADLDQLLASVRDEITAAKAEGTTTVGFGGGSADGGGGGGGASAGGGAAQAEAAAVVTVVAVKRKRKPAADGAAAEGGGAAAPPEKCAKSEE